MDDNKDSAKSIASIAVAVLALLGIPSAVAVAFWSLIEKNVVVAVVGILLYEVLVLVLGFVAGVWRKLRGRWIDIVANKVDALVIDFVSDNMRKYREYMMHQNRSLDIRGLSVQGPFRLETQKTFVHLKLNSLLLHKASNNPLRVLDVMDSAEERTLGRFLDQFPAENFVIVGPPGAGKTTMLMYYCLVLLKAVKDAENYSSKRRVPIFLSLRHYAQIVIDNEQFGVAEAVHHSLSRTMSNPPSVNWFERKLQGGACVVMLDGLDEVALTGDRKKVAAWVERQILRYGTSQFLLTSRPHGYRDNPLQGVIALEVLPFNAEQIRRFLENWYVENEIRSVGRDDPGVRREAGLRAVDLFRRIMASDSLYSLAVNPLLLTMIVTVHRYRGALPGRRIDLYEEICGVFLGKRHEARGMTLEMSHAQKQRVLEDLAYYMMSMGVREVSELDAIEVVRETLALVRPDIEGADFMKEVYELSGLLVEKEVGVYSFAHLTFQEYLASTYLRRQPNALDVILGNIGNSWWHEVIRLYVAKANGTPVVAKCLATRSVSPESIILAIACGEEALELSVEMRNKLESTMRDGLASSNLQLRHVISQAMLGDRARQAKALDTGCYVDSSLIMNCEYKLYIDEMRQQGAYVQPDHWTDLFISPKEMQSSITGVRSTDAKNFCNWVNDRERGRWLCSLPSEHEAERIATDEQSRTEPVGIRFWAEDKTSGGFVKYYSTGKSPGEAGEPSWLRYSYDTLVPSLGEQLEADVRALDEYDRIEVCSAVLRGLGSVVSAGDDGADLRHLIDFIRFEKAWALVANRGLFVEGYFGRMAIEIGKGFDGLDILHSSTENDVRVFRGLVDDIGRKADLAQSLSRTIDLCRHLCHGPNKLRDFVQSIDVDRERRGLEELRGRLVVGPKTLVLMQTCVDIFAGMRIVDPNGIVRLVGGDLVAKDAFPFGNLSRRVGDLSGTSSIPSREAWRKAADTAAVLVDSIRHLYDEVLLLRKEALNPNRPIDVGLRLDEETSGMLEQCRFLLSQMRYVYEEISFKARFLTLVDQFVYHARRVGLHVSRIIQSLNDSVIGDHVLDTVCSAPYWNIAGPGDMSTIIIQGNWGRDRLHKKIVELTSSGQSLRPGVAEMVAADLVSKIKSGLSPLSGASLKEMFTVKTRADSESLERAILGKRCLTMVYEHVLRTHRRIIGAAPAIVQRAWNRQFPVLLQFLRLEMLSTIRIAMYSDLFGGELWHGLVRFLGGFSESHARRITALEAVYTQVYRDMVALGYNMSNRTAEVGILMVRRRNEHETAL